MDTLANAKPARAKMYRKIFGSKNWTPTGSLRKEIGAERKPRGPDLSDYAKSLLKKENKGSWTGRLNIHTKGRLNTRLETPTGMEGWSNPNPAITVENLGSDFKSIIPITTSLSLWSGFAAPVMESPTENQYSHYEYPK